MTVVSKKNARIDLPSECGMSGVTKFYQQLKSVVELDKIIILDASKVTRIDASTLQVLFSFIETRKNAKLECRWDTVSDAFSEAVAVLGLGTGLCLS